jgi:hypothetical protein
MEYALFCTLDFLVISAGALRTHLRSPTKSLLVIYLCENAITRRRVSSFGAASASVVGNKEAANSAT